MSQNPYAPPAGGQQTSLAQAPPNKELKLRLSGTFEQHGGMLHEMLSMSAWTVTWDQGGWSGKATKGSQIAHLFLGALAQYYEVRFAFQDLGDGTIGLSLHRAGTGCMGGLIGAYRVRKAFQELSQGVYTGYTHHGVVVWYEGS